MSKGDFARARAQLVEVRKRFLAFTMPEEAALAGLDIVEGHVALNETGHAKALIETIIAEFQRAGLNNRAVTALAYLRDVLNTDSARRTVAHVRAYLDALRNEPQRLFAPPPD